MSQDIRNIIATNVNKLRVLRHLKREELSLLLGFNNSYISKLEKGKINITIDKLDKIASFFNVNIKELFNF